MFPLRGRRITDIPMVLFYMPKDFQELYELRLHGTGRAKVLYQFCGCLVNSIDQTFDVRNIHA